jgi:DNA-binding HxlR family transcriptional regulator
VLSPKFNIHGLRRADLKPYLPKLSDSALSRQLKRLHVFGLIKRVAGSYRYYLTKLGRAATAACVRVMEFTILPTLATTA